VLPPFLNGRAVFANKHLAHASRGDKCKERGISHPCRGAVAERKGRPKGGLHKRSAEDRGHSLSRRDGVPQEVWFPCFARSTGKHLGGVEVRVKASQDLMHVKSYVIDGYCVQGRPTGRRLASSDRTMMCITK
jgi:hypothetical protein